jgi:hypothetical protein
MNVSKFTRNELIPAGLTLALMAYLAIERLASGVELPIVNGSYATTRLALATARRLQNR